MEDIFNIIIQDKKFLENVKSSVNNIMIDGIVDISDIPEIILLITTTINTFNNLNINESMLPELIKKIFNFIIPDKNPDFDKIVNSAIKLVMFQPIIQKEVKKCCGFFSFFRKKEINTIQINDYDKVKDYDKVNDDKVNDDKVNDDKVKVNDDKVKVNDIVEEVMIIKIENITKSDIQSLPDIETTSDDDSVIINNDLDDVQFYIKENNVVDNLENTITLLTNNEVNKNE